MSDQQNPVLTEAERKALDRKWDCKLGCPVELTLEVIGGRWKGVIMYHLTKGTLRFGQLKRLIPGITQRMLTLQLRELEADGLVDRTVYPEVPPRVEYALSDVGRTLQPIIHAMLEWGIEHQDYVYGLRGRNTAS
ncbi:winged helix-turn-helix transcriptional regulator [Deinococcus cellulosilyticus]|uniref:MarR family transcriptional regulator n=1 Tax=Deinococcus cellulosilyticus (strain DSM 18568 / NBRC 106333 / KACC 11606 / 5516J-15) TaxID=1223518 RepID=A0A511N410_DEIC1|nr:helix-turn-helix domain-containing protein [Deinococcus cellulosilyticus]GEM47146.1 MarR family transcriptional regulator [Deinococcus cellulosilyticus NBRC 106333 = KACC 11606]